jgi:hypothetical protein
MKKINIIFLLSLFFILGFFRAKAQEDTINKQTILNPMKELDNNQKRKQQYLDVNFREEKTLFKLGISPLKFLSSEDIFSMANFSSFIGIEKKIIPSLSFINYNNFEYQSSKTRFLGWEFSSDIGLRYYYSMHKRIIYAIGANNFHSNYLSVNLNEGLKYRNINQANSPDSNVLVYPTQKSWTFKPLFCVSWGIQRRIGKWWFIDTSTYLEFNEDKYGFGVNLLFGFGIGQ